MAPHSIGPSGGVSLTLTNASKLLTVNCVGPRPRYQVINRAIVKISSFGQTFGTQIPISRKTGRLSGIKEPLE